MDDRHDRAAVLARFDRLHYPTTHLFKYVLALFGCHLGVDFYNCLFNGGKIN